jgi:outer membrane immunogenic protein
VFGLEAQGDWADLRGSNLSTLFGLGFRNDSRINAFGLFTGQLGWAHQQRPVLRQGRCSRDR